MASIICCQNNLKTVHGWIVRTRQPLQYRRWLATVTPDLSVKPEDISIIPTKITSIPTSAVLSVKVSNLGRTDVPQAGVSVYDGGITADKKVAEQVAAFPGQSSVTLTFAIPVNDSKAIIILLW